MYWFYRNPRRKNAVLLDVLPTLVEESATTEDDMIDENSGGDTNRTASLVSHNESGPVIKKMVCDFFFNSVC